MIQALVLDVDGVLTDGGIILDGGEGEWKRFHARDGVGIKLAQTAGADVLFLTARSSPPARRRARELGAFYAVGVKHKESFLETWLAERDIAWNRVAMVGDDLQDLGVLRRVGTPIAVADACHEVRKAAKYVTRVPGGAGAVRDAVEWLLDEAGIRIRTVQAFLNQETGFGFGEVDTGGPGL